MATRLTALVFLLMLVGCGRAPETSQVRQDVANRLAGVYGPGTFEIVAIDGRGSSADSTSPTGGERRVVYYDAELKPTRDIDLGAWNTPGVASLVTILGAGPKGITGVKPAATRPAIRSWCTEPRSIGSKATRGMRWRRPVSPRRWRPRRSSRRRSAYRQSRLAAQPGLALLQRRGLPRVP